MLAPFEPLQDCFRYDDQTPVQAGLFAKPLPDEPVVRKQRYSGFVGTDLDLVLKTLGVKYCAFIGGATNVCVGTTLMDAYSHDYFPILVKDAVFTQCPPVTVEATLWNVENIFGWVTSTADLLAAFGA